jgi:hypothetical protein
MKGSYYDFASPDTRYEIRPISSGGDPKVSKLLTDVGGFLNRIAESSPRDIQLVAERLHDHAVEERMSAADLRAVLAELGYSTIADFCDAAGIATHVARRWERFGVSSEMRAVLLMMQGQRRQFDQATGEFEAITHVGLVDFLRSRKV